MQENGVLVKKAQNRISNKGKDFCEENLFSLFDEEKEDVKQNLRFQIITVSTIVISLFEELEIILQDKPYELRANPENGFESNIVVERRLIEAIKTLILCSLKYMVSGTVIDIRCSVSKIQIYIQSENQISDSLVLYFQRIISDADAEEETIIRALNWAKQIICFSRATLDIEKSCDNTVAWKISFWDMKK